MHETTEPINDISLENYCNTVYIYTTTCYSCISRVPTSRSRASCQRYQPHKSIWFETMPDMLSPSPGIHMLFDDFVYNVSHKMIYYWVLFNCIFLLLKKGKEDFFIFSQQIIILTQILRIKSKISIYKILRNIHIYVSYSLYK